ncbi:MAG: SanA protein [Clostridiales bacterium GWF2_38_85]|nr:MAG: SanA protein [Clostridiales bacterium GWF2_38_85]HBL85128.1 SanA protein [Clostridiales bacterium]
MSDNKKAKKKKHILLRIIIILLVLSFLMIAFVTGINLYVKASVKAHIITPEAAAELNADCIIVLGAYVMPNGYPSDMLEDRILRGIELYENGASGKIIMSGDHGQSEYDEVNIMKQYAVEKGIPSSDIFMDHAGFSTYESLYRARDIFLAKKVIIITQEYHLYRALYIAEQLGLEAYGVASNQHEYIGQTNRDIREILARVKDFGYCIFQPEPTYLGETIPVFGDGDSTND